MGRISAKGTMSRPDSRPIHPNMRRDIISAATPKISPSGGIRKRKTYSTKSRHRQTRSLLNSP